MSTLIEKLQAAQADPEWIWNELEDQLRAIRCVRDSSKMKGWQRRVLSEVIPALRDLQRVERQLNRE